MVIDVNHAMSFQGLPTLHAGKSRFSNINRLIELFRQLAEESIQS